MLGICLIGFVAVEIILVSNQLLQLCTLRRVWSDAVIRPPVSVRSDICDLIGKPRIIHRQTAYDSIVWTVDTGVIRGLPTGGGR